MHNLIMEGDKQNASNQSIANSDEAPSWNFENVSICVKHELTEEGNSVFEDSSRTIDGSLIKEELNVTIDEVYSYDPPEYVMKCEPNAIKEEPSSVNNEDEGPIDYISNNSCLDWTNPEVQLWCDICWAESKSEHQLIAHRYAHTLDTKYTCLLCYNIYSSKKVLQEHMLKTHCDSLLAKQPRKYLTKTDIKSKKMRFQCDTCLRGFYYRYELTAHKRLHTGDKPFECDECHKRFNNNSHLKIHRRIHTNEKPFECDICHKRFRDSSNFNTHKRIHTDDKPYQCDICHKRFTHSSSVKTHKRTHVKDKPFESGICGKGFLQKGNLLTHHIFNNVEGEDSSKTIDDCVIKGEMNVTIDEIYPYDPNEYNIKCEPNVIREGPSSVINEYKGPIHYISNNSCVDWTNPEVHLWCDICWAESKSEHQLIAHRYTHTLDTKYTCLLCYNTYNSKQVLQEHMLQIHCDNLLSKQSRKYLTKTDIKSKTMRFQCDMCLRGFYYRYELTAHKRLHTGDKPFECDECHKCFHDNAHLKIHRRIHTNEKPYECDICHKRFRDSSNFNTHKRIHTDDKPYQCDICHKRFTHSSSVKAHKRTHGEVKPYECVICGKRFLQKGNLSTHQLIHADDTPYECDICHKRFKRKGHLTDHKDSHTDEKRYECDICHKLFKKSGGLNVHKRTHIDDKPLKCDICNKGFMEARKLDRHSRMHSKENRYKCYICHKRFPNASTLEVHKRAHNDNREFECDICYKRFNEKSGLKVHKFTHTDEKPHECSVCQSRFKLKHHLTRHKYVHENTSK